MKITDLTQTAQPLNAYPSSFNGLREDNELKGEGNSLDFGERFYDVRLGRFLSLDPLYNKYPNISPYAAFANNPIIFVDPDGRVVTDVLKKNVVTPLQEWYISRIALLTNKGDDVSLTSQEKEKNKKLLNRLKQESADFEAQVKTMHESEITYDYFHYCPIKIL